MQNSHYYPIRTFRIPFYDIRTAKHAGQTFQRFIDEVTNGLDFCYAYIDDILVFSKSEEEHKQHLRVLFGKLSDYGVIVNPKECVLGVIEVKFLSYLVSSEGTRPPLERVDALRQYPLPKSMQGLRRFLGMVNFYRRFIPEGKRCPICTVNSRVGRSVHRMQRKSCDRYTLNTPSYGRTSWTFYRRI